MNNRKTGNEKEEKVCEYLEDKGFRVIERNFNSRHGEIDIIALSDSFICFVEVKFRSTNKSGLPEEAVTPGKMKKICKTANYYLYTHREFYSRQMRFDVAAVDDKEIRYYENAFPFVGEGAF